MIQMRSEPEIEIKKFIRPEIQRTGISLHYRWPTWDLAVTVERFDDDGHAELTFYRPSTDAILLPARANLLDVRIMTNIANRLKQNDSALPWGDMLTFIAGKTLQIAREGESVMKLGTKPDTMKLNYRLWPILVEEEPTTIYGPGKTGKSYLATYIACLVQYDCFGFADSKEIWTPTHGNVLYLDWESNYKVHQRRTWAVKRGLGIENDDRTIKYLHLDVPLVKVVNQIQRVIIENDIKLVIVDSVIAAQSYGTDPAQLASQFYNALRSFRCTTLSIDHIAKSEMRQPDDVETIGPYGSVVKYNLSRQQFELKKYQVKGKNYIDLALIHRTSNDGALLDTKGIHVEFKYDSDGHLDKVTFSSLDVAAHPAFGAMRPLYERIQDALTQGGFMTPKEIQEEYIPDKTEGNIRATLNRYRDELFVRVGGKWGNKLE